MAISLRSMSGISNAIIRQSGSIGVGIAFSLVFLVHAQDPERSVLLMLLEDKLRGAPSARRGPENQPRSRRVEGFWEPAPCLATASYLSSPSTGLHS
jgi:hypothetical protein